MIFGPGLVYDFFDLPRPKKGPGQPAKITLGTLSNLFEGRSSVLEQQRSKSSPGTREAPATASKLHSSRHNDRPPTTAHVETPTTTSPFPAVHRERDASAPPHSVRLNAPRDGGTLNFRRLLCPQFGVASSTALIAPFVQGNELRCHCHGTPGKTCRGGASRRLASSAIVDPYYWPSIVVRATRHLPQRPTSSVVTPLRLSTMLATPFTVTAPHTN